MLHHQVPDHGALLALQVHRAPRGGAALIAHHPRPRLHKAGTDPCFGVDREVLLVMDIGVVKLQLSARLSVELNGFITLAAAEPAPDDSLVAVTRLHQGQLQLLDLGPVVALHDALQVAVLSAHVEAVVPVAHQAPCPLLLLKPAALNEAPVEERVITEENEKLI